MMTAAARIETLPIRLIAEAPRNIRSNLGRLGVSVCVWVMHRERIVPTIDAPAGTLFLSDAGSGVTRSGRRENRSSACAGNRTIAGAVDPPVFADNRERGKCTRWCHEMEHVMGREEPQTRSERTLVVERWIGCLARGGLRHSCDPTIRG